MMEGFRHFVGGFALTTLVMTLVSSHSFREDGKRVALGMAFFIGSLFGILGGLAAWGLL